MFLHLNIPVGAQTFDDVPPRLLKMWNYPLVVKKAVNIFLQILMKTILDYHRIKFQVILFLSEPGDAVFSAINYGTHLSVEKQVVGCLHLILDRRKYNRFDIILDYA